jgi:hypothetical protein
VTSRPLYIRFSVCGCKQVYFIVILVLPALPTVKHVHHVLFYKVPCVLLYSKKIFCRYIKNNVFILQYKMCTPLILTLNVFIVCLCVCFFFFWVCFSIFQTYMYREIRAFICALTLLLHKLDVFSETKNILGFSAVSMVYSVDRALCIYFFSSTTT